MAFRRSAVRSRHAPHCAQKPSVGNTPLLALLFRSGAFGASTRGELAPPLTPQNLTRRHDDADAGFVSWAWESDECAAAQFVGRGVGKGCGGNSQATGHSFD